MVKKKGFVRIRISSSIYAVRGLMKYPRHRLTEVESESLKRVLPLWLKTQKAMCRTSQYPHHDEKQKAMLKLHKSSPATLS